MSRTAEHVIVRSWNRPQSEFLKCATYLLDYEGGIRSGKTTALVWKLINYALEYPGIKMLLARWTGDGVDMQLKPKFYEECPREVLGKWNAKEEWQEFTNGSILYLRPLKSSDDSSRYGKFSGLTLAVIGVDQAEEVPRDIYHALKGRLSQIGYPHQMSLTPNPPAPNHWLVDEFPEDNHIEGHHYLCTSLYDNRHILGEQLIQELEREYPVGHVLRRRFIEGRRGLSIEGEPVYKPVFSRDLHVREVDFLVDYPLIESWDFGQRHPAVSWHQLLPWGWWNVLGCYQGNNLFIDQAVPQVAAMRTELFPTATQLLVCCDPSGADRQGQGTRRRAVDVLNGHLRGVYGPTIGARFVQGSNQPEKRQFAIQQISGYLGRLVQGRPAMLFHPRAEILIDGLEAGYVYDDRAFTNQRLPNFRRPKKDGYYDHLQNTLEYVALNFGAFPVGPVEAAGSVHDRLRTMQYDEDDFTWGRQASRKSLAGY